MCCKTVKVSGEQNNELIQKTRRDCLLSQLYIFTGYFTVCYATLSNISQTRGIIQAVRPLVFEVCAQLRIFRRFLTSSDTMQ